LGIAELETLVISGIEKCPIISYYVRSRGWGFIISWAQRISGCLMVLYLLFHIYNLISLNCAEMYNQKMEVFKRPIFTFLEWLLGLPALFHAINGGRLILYEGYGKRTDEKMLRWVFSIVLIYLGILGVLMISGNENVSEFFFWLITVVTAMVIGISVTAKIWDTRNSILWKLQRISGAFLLVAVPAHILFMHLNPSMAKESVTVITRMQSWFIKGVDIGLLLLMLYHAGYGVFAIVRDFCHSRMLMKGVCVLLFLVMGFFAWLGLTFTVGI